MNAEQAYQKLISKEKERTVIASLDAVLSWDEATFMPLRGVALRAEQKAVVAKLAHAALVDPQVGECLERIRGSAILNDEVVAANFRELARLYDKAVKLPSSLVEALARASTAGREAWIEARRRSDFQLFKPHLERVLDLRKQEAAALAMGSIPYNAMLDIYEPGNTVDQTGALLGGLKARLVPLVENILAKHPRVENKKWGFNFSVDKQHEFGQKIIQAMGFDLERGRLDTTTHPFCSGFSPDDVRLTTRYQNESFTSALFSTVHEAGHGLYEQGLKSQAFGSPMGRACSMAMHESQSRLWENFVARSRSFWEHFYPMAKSTFTELADTSLDQFLAKIWVVQPSLIRVDADEVTYNLHIILRFELERKLFSGDLRVVDLPAAWNQEFQSLFGFKPPSDAQGVLQDVHWSGGDFGYFPTYTMGNCYAAQFAETAEAELGSLDDFFRRGELLPLREWLRNRIHVHGQRFQASELCERVTGQAISSDALLRHLEKRYLAG